MEEISQISKCYRKKKSWPRTKTFLQKCLKLYDKKFDTKTRKRVSCTLKLPISPPTPTLNLTLKSNPKTLKIFKMLPLHSVCKCNWGFSKFQSMDGDIIKSNAKSHQKMAFNRNASLTFTKIQSSAAILNFGIRYGLTQLPSWFICAKCLSLLNTTG